METKNKKAQEIRFLVQKLNATLEEAEKDNLIVEIRDNKGSLGKCPRFEVDVYEKVKY